MLLHQLSMTSLYYMRRKQLQLGSRLWLLLCFYVLLRLKSTCLSLRVLFRVYFQSD